MIPKAFIDQWRGTAPWASDHQVEQDLIISRALVEIFTDGFLAERLPSGRPSTPSVPAWMAGSDNPSGASPRAG